MVWNYPVRYVLRLQNLIAFYKCKLIHHLFAYCARHRTSQFVGGCSDDQLGGSQAHLLCRGLNRHRDKTCPVLRQGNFGRVSSEVLSMCSHGPHLSSSTSTIPPAVECIRDSCALWKEHQVQNKDTYLLV